PFDFPPHCHQTRVKMKNVNALIVAATIAVPMGTLPCHAGAADFGPANTFYARSELPFPAPPFDPTTEGDYQPAIEAGMAEQLAEIERIADDSAAPTFVNTFIAMERSGRLLDRALASFRGVSQADTNPALQSTKAAVAPTVPAH